MGEAESASQISVGRDQEFNVELQSYPGSGAKWQFVPQSDGPRLVKQDSRPNDKSIGAAATQVFTFRADAPGTYKLLFELKRAWEPTARNRKEINVVVS
jgi:predicted secreted protein